MPLVRKKFAEVEAVGTAGHNHTVVGMQAADMLVADPPVVRMQVADTLVVQMEAVDTPAAGTMLEVVIPRVLLQRMLRSLLEQLLRYWLKDCEEHGSAEPQHHTISMKGVLIASTAGRTWFS